MHRTASPAAAAAARTRLYALLCLATAPPEPWQRGWLHGHLAPLAFRIGSRLPFAGFRGGLLRLRRHLGRTSDRELAVQHAQLDRWAPPYESHYLDPEGLLMARPHGQWKPPTGRPVCSPMRTGTISQTTCGPSLSS